MPTFTHAIRKKEIESHTIWLVDNSMKDHGQDVPTSKVVVHCNGKSYKATLTDSYIDGKFLTGIYFDPKKEESNGFFYEQSVNLGHHAEISYDKDAALEGEHFPIQMKMELKTK